MAPAGAYTHAVTSRHKPCEPKRGAMAPTNAHGTNSPSPLPPERIQQQLGAGGAHKAGGSEPYAIGNERHSLLGTAHLARVWHRRIVRRPGEKGG